VLLTGAAGRIGSVLREGLHGRVGVLRLLDHQPLGQPAPGEELYQADIADLAAVERAVGGADAVVHLAGIPDEDAFARIVQANIVGTHNVFEAARRRGCPRVVYASSCRVIGFYPRGQRIDPAMPVRPDTYYGVSKAFGENLGRFYADRFGLEVACVRVGSFEERPSQARHLSTWLSHRDAVQLVWCCLTAPRLGFSTVWGVSGNQRGWWDNRAAEQLGYRPADDAERYAGELEGGLLASTASRPPFEQVQGIPREGYDDHAPAAR
jgi:uronate dehydrogenase